MIEEFAEAKYMIAKSVRITPKKPRAMTKERMLFCMPLNRKNMPDIPAVKVRIPLTAPGMIIWYLPLNDETTNMNRERNPITKPVIMWIIISGTENPASIMNCMGDCCSDVLMTGAKRLIHIPKMN